MAHLVTGHAGIEHIKPSDDGAFNIGIFGNGQYVFPIGEQFEYEIISNNLIKIKSGELVNQGRHINIPVNNYEEVTIENGLQGVKRYDIIVMRYEKNPDTSIESASVVVLKGTSSANPNDPSLTIGNIYEGANVSDMPLYRVRLDGLNIVGVDRLFDVIPSIESMRDDIEIAKNKSNVNEYCNVKLVQVNNSTKLTVTDEKLAGYDYVTASLQNWGNPIKYVEYATNATSFTVHLVSALTGGVSVVYTAIKM